MEQSVIVLKAKTDKASLKTFAYQVAQITTQATKSNIQIVDCIVTFGGVKDVLREVKKLDGQKRFSSILIYSPSQICKNALEYQDLVETLEKDFKVGVEMSRNVQSGNTQNLKSTVIQRSFPKWSVAERRKTAAASDQAAVCACAHSRYFTGGSPSGLRV